MAEFLVNLASGKTDEKGIFRFLGKLFNQSGVIEATALTVTAQASPDMTVKVSGSVNADSVVFQNSNGDFYGGWNAANYNVTITANSSGSTKTDAIVAYADTAAGSTTANNPGGLKLIAVRGASGTTTDAEINTFISNKPFVRLANVTVGNGVSSINSGNIADTRPTTQLRKGIAGLVENMRTVRVQNSPPPWNNLAAATGATQSLTFTGLSTIYFVIVNFSKGAGGSNMDRLTWSISEDLPSTGATITLRVYNNDAAAAFVSTANYIAFGV